MWSKGSDKLAEPKKFYWIKLQKDFFKQHTIKVIEAMPNGKDYILFYLKLLVESVSHNGNLRFSDTIPYNAEMLAAVTNTNVDTVRSATKVFTELKMMDVLDDQTIYMTELQKMVGCETEWAAKKRMQRATNQSLLKDNAKTIKGQKGTMSDKSIELRDKSIDNKENIEKTPDKPATEFPYEQLRESFILNCPSLPKPNEIKDWTPTRKKAIRDKKFPVTGFTTVFKRIEESDFLTGRKTGWHCSLDWILKPANWQKINEGNYDNRKNNLSESKDLTFDVDEYERATNPLYEK